MLAKYHLVLVCTDPVEEGVQRRIFLQPMLRLRVFHSQLVVYPFIADGGEFLLGKLADPVLAEGERRPARTILKTWSTCCKDAA